MEHPTPDCREVLEKLYLYLDREIAGGDCSAIELHLAACEDCLHHADFERAFKEIVRRKCSESTVPSELIVRIRARMREVR